MLTERIADGVRGIGVSVPERHVRAPHILSLGFKDGMPAASSRARDRRRLRRPASRTNAHLTPRFLRRSRYRPLRGGFGPAAEHAVTRFVGIPVQTRNVQWNMPPTTSRLTERYKLLAGFVLPRPIAWVTNGWTHRRSQRRRLQLFQCVLRGPAALHVRGQPADPTAASRTRWPTSSVPESSWSTSPMSRWPMPMHDSSGDFPPEIGEPGYARIEVGPSTKIAAPRLADAPWAMECKVWKTMDVDGKRQLIMGEGNPLPHPRRVVGQ